VPGGDWVRGGRLDGFGQVPGMAGPERFELEAAGVQSPFELRVVVAVAAKQLPVPPGCVRDLRLPGEIGLLVVFADPAAMAGSAVLPVCP
jgi:hypothetical protein